MDHQFLLGLATLKFEARRCLLTPGRFNPEVTGVYNAGFENISIMDIARLVTRHVPVEMVVTASNDPRSYRVNSDQTLATGFKPRKTVENAPIEIIEECFSNPEWMQKTVPAK